MSELKLIDREWREFKIADVFDIFTGALIDKKIINDGDIPRISATDLNNGISMFTNDITHKNFRKFTNFISISFLGSVFFQANESSLDMKIHGIKPKEKELNSCTAKFLIPLIKNFTFKYRYGYQLSTSVLKTQKILLPIKKDSDKPDWQFMEDYIKQIEKGQREKIINYYNSLINKENNISLEIKWGEFNLVDIFSVIKRGKRLKKADHKDGINPYISSTVFNNGVDGFVGNESAVRVFNNCLTIANSGSVGSTFYQPYKFIASDHVTTLKNQKANKYIYLFLANMIGGYSAKYSFNREINDTRLKKEKILLPINEKGRPHWQFMEDYIKNLEYQKLQKYLTYCKEKIS